MKRFVIERELPGVGSLGNKELRETSMKSNEALAELGPDIQWVHSYVVADRTFCIYLAADEELIHRHSQLSGIPVKSIHEVKRIIDPTTANAVVRVRA